MTALADILRKMIAAKGPITVADYMELALQHPEHGYYRQANPLGKDGDFITAPEISQMFGEMIGLWCADLWQQMGKPGRFALLELGPGRGTLMQDALRATAKIRGFHDAVQLYLLESHAGLRKLQQDRLLEHLPAHIENVDGLPPEPIIFVANEFFDALPIRQFEKTADGWCERMVGLSGNALALTLSAPDANVTMLMTEAVKDSAVGTVHEVCLPGLTIIRQLAKHIAHYGGGGLVIDYGYGETSGRSSLQAVSKHSAVDVFEHPGEVDLTAHVDFGALRLVGSAQAIKVTGPVGQSDFLNAMGIDLRATQLKQRATQAQAEEIDAALQRLTDAAQMGQLFKGLALTAPQLQPAGF